MLGQRSIFVCVLLVTGLFVGGCSATPQLKSVPEVQKQIESNPPAPASTSHADIYAKETGLKKGLTFAQWNINMSAAEKAGRVTVATTTDLLDNGDIKEVFPDGSTLVTTWPGDSFETKILGKFVTTPKE